jgi:hypothetical protein
VNPEKLRLETVHFGRVTPSFIRGMVEEDGSCVCVDGSLLLILSLPEINDEEQQALYDPALLYYSRNEEGGVPTPVMTFAFDELMTIDVPFYLFSDSLEKNSLDILLVDSATFQIRGHRKAAFSLPLLAQLQEDMRVILHDPDYLERIYDVFDNNSGEMLMEKSVFKEVLL